MGKTKFTEQGRQLPPVHRTFYPTAKMGEDSVPPFAKASPVIGPDGVSIEFFQTERSFTPTELSMLARWLYNLAHEAEALARQGLITETQSHDVSRSSN